MINDCFYQFAQMFSVSYHTYDRNYPSSSPSSPPDSIPVYLNYPNYQAPSSLANSSTQKRSRNAN